jgi:hypothetical protein
LLRTHRSATTQTWSSGRPTGKFAGQTDNGRFVRQELLDQIVWAEVIRLHPDVLEISGVARSCKGSREPSPKIEPRLV